MLLKIFAVVAAFATITTYDASASLKVDHIIVRKKDRELILLNRGEVIKEYSIQLGKNPEGAKLFEGDNKTPEGDYTIAYKNPKSQYHLALKVSYPSQEDIERAKFWGKSAGGDIMIHGMPNGAGWFERFFKQYEDWTAGCIAVDNDEISEIYEMVDAGTPISIRP